MHIIIGVFLALFGAAFVVLAPRLAEDRRLSAYNRQVFRVIGSVIAIAGLLYACGLWGR
ncbi:hypothetical protein ACIHEJ_34715 [Streptomyces sp. NPDC052301]|uniref:hypothetical protein n=1 Tax=Streptomyces sp. NPDC052301 TaxID=3365687 RepID=UPI0037D4D7C2